MIKFKGHKSRDQIAAQVKAHRQGGGKALVLNDKNWRNGSDYIALVCGSGAYVMYNTFNGRFHGLTDTGIPFNSDSEEHDRKPWMKALLRFFYGEPQA